MTRRDFILIAGMLRRYNAEPLLISGMADALAGTNPRFDRPRFLRESGMFRNAVVQPPAVGDTYTGEKLLNSYAGRPLTSDNFQMSAFCEALHRDEREREHIEHMRPVKLLRKDETLRQAVHRDAVVQREMREAGIGDYRHVYMPRVAGGF